MTTNRSHHLTKAALSILLILCMLFSGVAAYAEDAVQAVRDVIRASGDVPQGSGTYAMSASNNILSYGQTAQAEITGDAESIAQVFWASSNEDLLVVEREGYLRCTGVQQADTQVTVSATVLTWGGQNIPVSGQFTIQGGSSQNIDAKAPASLSASEAFLRDTLFLYPGEVFTLSPTLPVGSQITQYTNTSPQVALLRENGDIEAKTPGETVVTLAVSANPEQQVSVRVTVLDSFNRESAGPRPSISRLTLWQGEKITPVFVGGQSVTWSSSNPAVASVSPDGTIAAVGEGSTLITLDSADGSFQNGLYIDVPGLEFSGVASSALKESADGVLLMELPEGESIVLDMALTPGYLKGALYTSESSDATVVAASGQTLTAQMGAAGKTATVIVMGATKQGLVSRIIQVTVTPGDKVLSTTGSSRKKLVLDPSVMTIEIGEHRTITASYSPSGKAADVYYVSSNPDIATVDNNGVVTGISEGSVTITAKTDDGKYTADAVVTVVRYTITGLSLTPAALTIELGTDATLTAAVLPAGAKHNLQFTSSAPEIVRVNATTATQAQIHAVARGTATITVTDTYTGMTATSVITVKRRADAVEIYESGSAKPIPDGNGYYIEVGEKTVKLTADTIPTLKNVDIKSIVWHSGNDAVAVIGKDGKILGVGEGQTRIYVTVTSWDGSTVTDSVPVLVVEKKIKAVTVYPAPPQYITLVVGEVVPINIEYTPSTLPDKYRGMKVTMENKSPDGTTEVVGVTFKYGNIPYQWVAKNVGLTLVTFTSLQDSTVKCQAWVQVIPYKLTADDVYKVVIEEVKNGTPVSIPAKGLDLVMDGDDRTYKLLKATAYAKVDGKDVAVDISDFYWDLADSSIVESWQPSNMGSNYRYVRGYNGRAIPEEDDTTITASIKRLTNPNQTVKSGAVTLNVLFDEITGGKIIYDNIDTSATGGKYVAGATPPGKLEVELTTKYNGTPDPDKAKVTHWDSSDKNVADFQDATNGIIRFLGGDAASPTLPGNTTIKATLGEVPKEITGNIQVYWDTLKELQVLPALTNLIPGGESRIITAEAVSVYGGTVFPGTLDSLNVEWTSTATAAQLTIAKNAAAKNPWSCEVTAKEVGDWVITATGYGSGGTVTGTADIKARIADPVGLIPNHSYVEIIWNGDSMKNPPQLTLEWKTTIVGFTLPATVKSWSVVSGGSVTVDANGNLTVSDLGTTVLKATCEYEEPGTGKKTTKDINITVEVRDPLVADLVMVQGATTAIAGKAQVPASDTPLEVEIIWEDNSDGPKASTTNVLWEITQGNSVTLQTPGAGSRNTQMYLNYLNGNPSTVRAYVPAAQCVGSVDEFVLFTVPVQWDTVKIVSANVIGSDNVAVGSNVTVQVVLESENGGTLVGNPNRELVWPANANPLNTAFTFSQYSETISGDGKTATVRFYAEAKKASIPHDYEVQLKSDASVSKSVELRSEFDGAHLVFSPSGLVVYLEGNGEDLSVALYEGNSGTPSMPGNVTYTWTVEPSSALIKIEDASPVSQTTKRIVPQNGATEGTAYVKVVAKTTEGIVVAEKTCEVQVKASPAVDITPAAADLNYIQSHAYVGLGGTLHATVNWLADAPPAPYSDITWESKTPSIVSIDANGNYTFLDAGRAIIHVSVGGKTAEIEVQVEWDTVKVEAVDPSNTGSTRVGGQVPFTLHLATDHGGTMVGNHNAWVTLPTGNGFFYFVPSGPIFPTIGAVKSEGTVSFTAVALKPTTNFIDYDVFVGNKVGTTIRLEAVRVADHIEVTGSTFTINTTGGTYQFKATLKDKDGNILAPATYSFTSTSNLVVTPTAPTTNTTGDFTVEAAPNATSGMGNVTVTANDGTTTVTETFYFTIIKPGVVGFSLYEQTNYQSSQSYIAHPSDGVQLAVQNVIWSDGTTTPTATGVTWGTSNASVASVSSSGLVMFKKAGTATITATIGNISKSIRYTVAWDQVLISSFSPESTSAVPTDVSPNGTRSVTANLYTANGGIIDQSQATLQMTGSTIYSLADQSNLYTSTPSTGYIVFDVRAGGGSTGDTATVRTVSGGSKSATFKSRYTGLSLTVSPYSVTIPSGSSMNFTAEIVGAGANPVQVAHYQWSLLTDGATYATLSNDTQKIASLQAKTGLSGYHDVGLSVEVTLTDGTKLGPVTVYPKVGQDPVKTIVRSSSTPSSFKLYAGGETAPFTVELYEGSTNITASTAFTWEVIGGANVLTDTPSANGATQNLKAPDGSSGGSYIRVSAQGASETFYIAIEKAVPSNVVVGYASGSAADQFPGKTITLKVNTIDWSDGGTTPPRTSYTVKWTSDNPSVATVDQNTGVVSMHSPGTANITATVDGVATGTKDIVVAAPDMENDSVYPNNIKIGPNGVYQIELTYATTPAGTTLDTSKITWAVVDASVAELSTLTGKSSTLTIPNLTADAATTIQIYYNNVLKDTISVTVTYNFGGITVTSAGPGLLGNLALIGGEEGGAPTLGDVPPQMMILLPDGTFTEMTGEDEEETGDENAEEGAETEEPEDAENEGQQVITINPDLLTDEIIAIMEAEADQVEENEETLTGIEWVTIPDEMTVGDSPESTSIKLIGSDGHTPTRDVFYSSSNDNIAYISARGVIVAFNEGEVTITAKAKDADDKWFAAEHTLVVHAAPVEEEAPTEEQVVAGNTDNGGASGNNAQYYPDTGSSGSGGGNAADSSGSTGGGNAAPSGGAGGAADAPASGSGTSGSGGGGGSSTNAWWTDTPTGGGSSSGGNSSGSGSSGGSSSSSSSTGAWWIAEPVSGGSDSGGDSSSSGGTTEAWWLE